MKLGNRKVLHLLVATLVLFGLAVGVALAQSAPASTSTSTVFCNLLNFMYPLSTRAIIAVIAGMAAIAQMWSESSNIMTWIKRHQVMFIFAVALIAGPTLLVSILGASSSGCSFS